MSSLEIDTSSKLQKITETVQLRENLLRVIANPEAYTEECQVLHLRLLSRVQRRCELLQDNFLLEVEVDAYKRINQAQEQLEETIVNAIRSYGIKR